MLSVFGIEHVNTENCKQNRSDLFDHPHYLPNTPRQLRKVQPHPQLHDQESYAFQKKLDVWQETKKTLIDIEVKEFDDCRWQ